MHIRLPILLPEFEKKRLTNQFIEWAKQRLDEKPHFHYDRYKSYRDGDKIDLFDEHYTIRIDHSDGRSMASIQGNQLYLILPAPEELEIYEKTLSQMIYKKR